MTDLEPLLKFRDVVSFSGHALRPWARIVGRCLQLLITELCGQGIGIGFQNLRGVCMIKLLPWIDSPQTRVPKVSPPADGKRYGGHVLGDTKT